MGNQIYDTLNSFFYSYLTRRDLEATLDHVTDQIISLGTGAQEVALGKDQFRQLLSEEFAELPTPIDYKIINYKEFSNQITGRSVFCNVVAGVEDENGNRTSMDTRLTAEFCYLQDRWQISCLHMSTAAAFQEENEFFPLKFGQISETRISNQTKKSLMQLLKEVIPGGIMGGYLEPGFPLYVINDEMLRYLDCSFEELMKDTGGMMINTIHADDRKMVISTINRSMAEKEEYSVNYRLLKKSGTCLWVNDKGKLIITEDGRKAMISVITDMSDSVNQQERLRKEAIRDPLTQILNRREGIRLIEHMIMTNPEGVLVMIDIDNFKQVNDCFGHQAGDEVLQRLADILTINVRDNDIAARLGGDEFIIYLQGIKDVDQAIMRIEKARMQFAEYCQHQFPGVDLSISAGISLRDVQTDFKELYIRADKALYQAKKAGKGSICVSEE